MGEEGEVPTMGQGAGNGTLPLSADNEAAAASPASTGLYWRRPGGGTTVSSLAPAAACLDGGRSGSGSGS